MNFLFDIGNVLLLLDFPSFENTLYPEGIPPELWQCKDPYETGQMSDEEFIQKGLTSAPAGITEEQFTEAWNGIFSPHQPMWELAKRLKEEGHTLILFSNTNALHAASFLEKFEVFQHFDHHHFSQEVGAIKPDPIFYTSAIDQYQLVPAETVYFDDLAENIATGEALGFQCHQYDYRQHQEALNWLAEIMNLLPQNG